MCVNVASYGSRPASVTVTVSSARGFSLIVVPVSRIEMTRPRAGTPRSTLADAARAVPSAA